MKDDKINGASARPEEPQDDFEVRERKRWTFFGLPFTFTTYTLTPKKLTVQTGLFTTAEDDILLFRHGYLLPADLYTKAFRSGQYSSGLLRSQHS